MQDIDHADEGGSGVDDDVVRAYEAAAVTPSQSSHDDDKLAADVDVDKDNDDDTTSIDDNVKEDADKDKSGHNNATRLYTQLDDDDGGHDVDVQLDAGEEEQREADDENDNDADEAAMGVVQPPPPMLHAPMLPLTTTATSSAAYNNGGRGSRTASQPHARQRTHTTTSRSRHTAATGMATPRTPSASTPRLLSSASRPSMSIVSARSNATATTMTTDQVLHRASVVSAARYHASRRAASVARTVGLGSVVSPSSYLYANNSSNNSNATGGAAAAASTAGSVSSRAAASVGGTQRPFLTEAEVFALERMAERDERLQRARARAQQLSSERDLLVVQQELQRATSEQQRLLAREEAWQRRARASAEALERRTRIALQRRHELEAQRQQFAQQRIASDDQVMTDPFNMWYAKFRYATPQLRATSPITPARYRTVSPNNDNTSTHHTHLLALDLQQRREQQQQQAHKATRGSSSNNSSTNNNNNMMANGHGRMSSHSGRGVGTATPRGHYDMDNDDNDNNNNDNNGDTHKATSLVRRGRDMTAVVRSLTPAHVDAAAAMVSNSPLRWRSPSIQHPRPWH